MTAVWELQSYFVVLKKDLDSFNRETEDLQKWIKRMRLYTDIKSANMILPNYTIHVSVRKHQPTYWDISFYHNNTKRYKGLKFFVGEYGFVVSVKWSKNKKVLREEKKLKYTY